MIGSSASPRVQPQCDHRLAVRYLSVCSGIEAATVAWHPLGMIPAGFAEIDKFPSAVLKHHYPEVPNFGDFTQIKADDVGPIDILVGGTPCQSFSIAGLRGGLADGRGNLALEFLRLAQRTRPRWLVWENVPGVLSSDGGRDFGAILGGMVECGYGFAYRVLDAQYFGLAQRRKRVFVVGYLGDWRRAAAVLFERESLCWNPSPRSETGQAVAALTANGVGTCGADDNQGQAGHLIHCASVAPTLNAHYGSKQGLEDQHINGGGGLFIAHSLRAEGFDASEDGTGRGIPLVSAYRTTGNDGAYELGNLAGCLNTGTDPSAQILAFSCKDHGADAGDISPTLRAMEHSGSHANAGGQVAVVTGVTLYGSEGTVSTADFTDIAGALRARTPGGQENSSTTAVYHSSAVRRLTPRECERLQGFPDDYTLIPYRGKTAADGPRYRALGNSMAVPVMNWIGRSIALSPTSGDRTDHPQDQRSLESNFTTVRTA